MIKASKITLNFSNRGKVENILFFIEEYQSVVSFFVDILWDMEYISKLIPKEITEQVKTWLSARAIQAAAKQASGIVRGTRKKQQKRKFIIDKLNNEGKFKKARKLQKIYNETKVSKPNIKTVNPNLDSRFVKIKFDKKHFDGWIILASLGNKFKISIPFKKTKHFNKMMKKGTLKSSVILSKKDITFIFNISDPKSKNKGEIIGIDIGQTTLLSCSNSFTSKKNNHRHDLNSISDVLSRKKKGSKSFKKASEHRNNYINWSINQLNLKDVKQINIEDLKNVRKGKKTSKKLGHWTYSQILSKIESRSLEQGVLVKKINPTYTSKRCSECGWTYSRNRKGKVFKCCHCGNTMDADLNASVNISMDLSPIFYGGKKYRILDIKKGFFWSICGAEPIVPFVKEI